MANRLRSDRETINRLLRQPAYKDSSINKHIAKIKQQVALGNTRYELGEIPVEDNYYNSQQTLPADIVAEMGFMGWDSKKSPLLLLVILSILLLLRK